MRDWRRHLLHTRPCVKTTWKLRLGMLLVLILAVTLTQQFWIVQIGHSLVCAQEVAPSDVILIENFDPNYVVFERAAALERAGLAPRTLVPVQASRDPGVPNPIFKGIAEVMARQARLTTWEAVPIQEIEPISLNAAGQVRRRLEEEHVRSLILVTSAVRSRRSSLIYRAVLDDTDMQFRCDPVVGATRPEAWTATWHGVQEVVLEFLKLQYYRFYVLPVLFSRSRGGAA
jgi:hypothetical protein